jgi:hypothetical protein
LALLMPFGRSVYPLARRRRPSDPSELRILIIGDIARWKTIGLLQEDVLNCRYVAMKDTKKALIDPVDIVLSPLLGDDFDALDVVDVLKKARFQGRYCVLAQAMPDAKIVLDEIRALAPGLAVDLLMLPED